MPSLLSPTAPADPYSWAVQAATREYPRLSQFNPMRLTYNPRREGYSETFSPTEPANPFKGNWTVEMGESPYYYTPSSWPGLVGLESLHMMQAEDPRYQQMTSSLRNILTRQQQHRLADWYQQSKLKEHDERNLDQFAYGVYLPELIRDRMFARLFNRMEGTPLGGTKGVTPEEAKVIDQINRYMRTSGRTP